MRPITVIRALAMGLTLVLANSPVSARDYADFAKVSNKEQMLDDKACRKFGGWPVPNGQSRLVLNSGRVHDTYYNVIYYAGFQYVTYKIDASNSVGRFFGFQTFRIGLCQF